LPSDVVVLRQVIRSLGDQVDRLSKELEDLKKKVGA